MPTQHFPPLVPPPGGAPTRTCRPSLWPGPHKSLASGSTGSGSRGSWEAQVSTALERHTARPQVTHLLD